MAGQRARKIVAATFNGFPLMAEVEEYQPPEIKKIMEESRGGKFIADEVVVGIEKMSFTLKLSGVGSSILNAYGLHVHEPCQIDIRASEEDPDGKRYAIHDSLSGQITGIKEDDIKMGAKPTVTISGSLFAFRKTENKRVLYDINTKTQVINLGRGDLMVDHRRNVGIA